MAPLSNLSIGFIVGGSVIFASLILGFIAWRIIVNKRCSKSKNANPRTGQSRVETPTVNADVLTHQNNRGNILRESQYSEIHIEDDHHRTTAQPNTDSTTVQRQSVPIYDNTESPTVQRQNVMIYDNTDDSGYCEGQGSASRSEVYSKLHEVQNHVENVYGGFTDEDSGQGSYMRVNSVSVNSDGDKENECPVVTPPSKTLSNQPDQDHDETTPWNDTLSENNEMFYPVAVPRADIIEVHRQAVWESIDEVDNKLYTEKEDASDISGHSDELSEQDTSL